MKIKTKSLKQTYNSKLRTSLALSSKFCFLLFVFSFLPSPASAGISPEQLDPTNFLTLHIVEASKDVNTRSVPIHVTKPPSAQQQQSRSRPDSIGGPPVKSRPRVHQELPQRSFPDAGRPYGRLGRKLWQTRIAAPTSGENGRSRNGLKRIIEQIRSVEFEPQSKPPEPVIVIEPVLTDEPNETLSATEVLDQAVEEEIESKPGPAFADSLQSPKLLPYEPIIDQTLQMLANQLQHPDRLRNPFALAEILFLSGNLKEAAMLYKEALNRKRLEEAGSVQDRGWILFQIGNCLQDDDPSTSTKMYRQLIAEFPDSSWADLARVRDKLVDWYQKDKPRALVVEYQF